MRTLYSLFVLLALSLCFCIADSNIKEMNPNAEPGGIYVSGAIPVEGGSYAITNNYNRPWKLSSVWYVDTAGVTNTLTITCKRLNTTITEVSPTVVTNEFGNVQTNYLHSLTNTYSTNTVTLFTDTTTNVTSHVYTEQEDLPNGVYFMPWTDVITFSLSRTNKTYVYFNGVR